MDVSDVHNVRTIHSSARCWKAPLYADCLLLLLRRSVCIFVNISLFVIRCNPVKIPGYIWYWTGKSSAKCVRTSWNASLCYSWFLFHNNMLIIRVLVLILFACDFFSFVRSFVVRLRPCFGCVLLSLIGFLSFFTWISLYFIFRFHWKYMMFLAYSVFSTISPTYAI